LHVSGAFVDRERNVLHYVLGRLIKEVKTVVESFDDVLSRVMAERHHRYWCLYCASISALIIISGTAFYFSGSPWLPVLIMTVGAGALHFLVDKLDQYIFGLSTTNENNSAATEATGVLADYYASVKKSKSYLAIIVILAAAAVAAWLRESEMLVFCAVALTILFAHVAITDYRASRGFLGTNAWEARELIVYLIKKSESGSGPPPATRVARQYDDSENTKKSRRAEHRGWGVGA
jgi:hypothetical protein